MYHRPITQSAPAFCRRCAELVHETDGICPYCDDVVDRDAFFATYPDAPDTGWRPWLDATDPDAALWAAVDRAYEARAF